MAHAGDSYARKLFIDAGKQLARHILAVQKHLAKVFFDIVNEFPYNCNMIAGNARCTTHFGCGVCLQKLGSASPRWVHTQKLKIYKKIDFFYFIHHLRLHRSASLVFRFDNQANWFVHAGRFCCRWVGIENICLQDNDLCSKPTMFLELPFWRAKRLEMHTPLELVLKRERE